MRAVGSDSPRGPPLDLFFFFRNCDFWPHFRISRWLMGGWRVQLEGSLVVRLCKYGGVEVDDFKDVDISGPNVVTLGLSLEVMLS